MATRYCGLLTLRLSYRDASNDYRVCIATNGYHLATVYVGTPAYLTHAVDSPEAYDETARAALAFAEDDGGDLSDAAMDDSGYAVTRQPLSDHGIPLPRDERGRYLRPGDRIVVVGDVDACVPDRPGTVTGLSLTSRDRIRYQLDDTGERGYVTRSGRGLRKL